MNLHFGLFTSFIQLVYSLSVLCSFALQLFPLLEVIEGPVLKLWKYASSQEKVDIKYTARYALIVGAWGAGVWVRQIKTVLEVSGSVFACIMVFVIVPALYIRQKGGKVGYVRLAVNVMLMLTGVSNAVFGLYKHL